MKIPRVRETRSDAVEVIITKDHGGWIGVYALRVSPPHNRRALPWTKRKSHENDTAALTRLLYEIRAHCHTRELRYQYHDERGSVATFEANIIGPPDVGDRAGFFRGGEVPLSPNLKKLLPKDSPLI